MSGDTGLLQFMAMAVEWGAREDGKKAAARFLADAEILDLPPEFPAAVARMLEWHGADNTPWRSKRPEQVYAGIVAQLGIKLPRPELATYIVLYGTAVATLQPANELWLTILATEAKIKEAAAFLSELLSRAARAMEQPITMERLLQEPWILGIPQSRSKALAQMWRDYCDTAPQLSEPKERAREILDEAHKLCGLTVSHEQALLRLPRNPLWRVVFLLRRVLRLVPTAQDLAQARELLRAHFQIEENRARVQLLGQV